MSINITFNSGSGSIEPGSLIDLSYSESATPLEPSSLEGGVSQINFSAMAIDQNKFGNTHPNSKLLINNDVTITDSLNGMISAKVSKVSVNAGVASITADSALAKMNTKVSAPPVHGSLKDAAIAYCNLAYIEPVFLGILETDMQVTQVNLPAWTGNLWDKLKEFCASTLVEGKPIEVVATFDGITFRYANLNTINIDERKSDYSISIDSFDSAKTISVPRAYTEYGTNKVVYELSNYEDGVDPRNTFKASIMDSMQVEAGQTIKKRFNINATLDMVNQPVCVSTITRTPPAPYEGTTGEYVIVGSDNLPIKPSQWIGLGGSLTVDLTENPGEIEITVTAPPLSELEKESGGTGLAPYSIGVESSGEGEYPAFWITGTGVFYHQKRFEIPTGTDPETTNESAASVEATMLVDSDSYWSKAALAAQKACGPMIEAAISMPADLPYGTGIGSIFYRDSNKFRVNSVAYGVADASLSATPCAEIIDFNEIWTGKTFANFTSIALDPDDHPSNALLFNEFTVIPLMEAQ
jgi:hypothetical protein